MTDWKDAIKNVDRDVMHTLAIVVCNQTNCFTRGEPYEGNCAACADIADNVIGEYLLLSKDKP